MNDFKDNRISPKTLLAVVLFLAAAVAATMIPWRIQRLIDVGVRCGGVEYATPLRIRASTMDDLMLFLPDETAKEARRAYDLKDGVYLLHGTTDAKRLSDDFALPVLQYKRLSEQGVNTFAAIRAGLEHGSLTREDVIARANDAVAAMGELTPHARVEAAASFIRTEYAVAGGNAGALRERTVSAELGRMILFAAVALIAAGAGAVLAEQEFRPELRGILPAGLAVGAAVCGFVCGWPCGLVLTGEALVLLFGLLKLRPRDRRPVSLAACALAMAALPLTEMTVLLDLTYTPGRLVALLLWALLAAVPGLCVRDGKEVQP